jgi:hypothetical protein
MGLERKLLSWWANRIYIALILRAPHPRLHRRLPYLKRHVLEGIDRSIIKSNGYIFQAEMAYVTTARLQHLRSPDPLLGAQARPEQDEPQDSA